MLSSIRIIIIIIIIIYFYSIEGTPSKTARMPHLVPHITVYFLLALRKETGFGLQQVLQSGSGEHPVPSGIQLRPPVVVVVDRVPVAVDDPVHLAGVQLPVVDHPHEQFVKGLGEFGVPLPPGVLVAALAEFDHVPGSQEGILPAQVAQSFQHSVSHRSLRPFGEIAHDPPERPFVRILLLGQPALAAVAVTVLREEETADGLAVPARLALHANLSHSRHPPLANA